MAFEQVTQQIGQMPQLALQARVAALQEAARRQQLARMDQQQFVDYLMGGMEKMQQGQQRKEDTEYRAGRAKAEDDYRTAQLEETRFGREQEGDLRRTGLDIDQQRADATGRLQDAETGSIKLSDHLRERNSLLDYAARLQGVKRAELENDWLEGRGDRYEQVAAREGQQFEASMDLNRDELKQNAKQFEESMALNREELGLRGRELTASLEAGGAQAELDASKARYEVLEMAIGLEQGLITMASGQKPTDGSMALQLFGGGSGPLDKNGKAQLSELAKKVGEFRRNLPNAPNAYQAFEQFMSQAGLYGGPSPGNVGEAVETAVKTAAEGAMNRARLPSGG